MNRLFAEAISQILSLRGDKLTVLLRGQKYTANRSGQHVWVIRASPKPRAWCKRDVPAGQNSESWREARFPCDELLVHPEVCRVAMAEIVSVMNASRRWHLTPNLHHDSEAWRQEEQRRMAALARSRRLVRELRQQDAFAGLGVDVLKFQLARIRSDFGVWNPERDEESDMIQASGDLHCREPAKAFSRSPDSVSSSAEPQEIRKRTIHLTTETMIARRQLIRWWLRLKWLKQWLGNFPPDAMELLKQPLPTRRWHLLNLWLRIPDSRDLLRDIPALAFAMASANAFRANPVCRPLRSMRILVRGRRKRLLAWLGFPAMPLTLRLLRLVRPEDVTMEVLFDLRRLMQYGPRHAAELVCLGKPLDRWTLGLVSLPIPPTLPLLRAMMDADREEQSLWRDSVRIARTLQGAGECIERLHRLKSLRALKETHDHLLAIHRAQAGQIPAEVAGKFPLAAPFLAMTGITPLTGLNAVISESFRMNHCLDTFLAPMASGRYFAYAIHINGERATLGLRREGDNWLLDQLRGPKNSPVSVKLRQFVAEWLSPLAG